MAYKTVTYSSTSKLPCTQCAPADVILCVNPDKIEPSICPGSEEQYEPIPEPYTYRYIYGQIINWYRPESVLRCPSGIYSYVISYDDAQIRAGETLETIDVNGVVCKGCLTTWIEDFVGNEPTLLLTGENTYTYTSPHGCQTTFETGGGGGGGNFNLIPFLFGDGSDGDFTVGNGEDLLLPFPARNYHFENLTIDEGGVLHPYGYFLNDETGDPADREYYQIFVSGTLTINGTISADGAAAPAASGRVNSGPCHGSGAGQHGGDWGEYAAGDGPGGGDDAGGCGGIGGGEGNSPTAGGASGRQRASGAGYMGGGLGGAGGDNATGLPGYVPQLAVDGDYYPAGRLMLALFSFSSGGSYIANAIGGGSGGGGGAGGGDASGTALGGMGGGGGAGAGSIFIAAKNIVIGSTGKISANGGDGANGADATLGGLDSADGGGGGGGGGGGLVYLVYETLENNGAIEVNGGQPGQGGEGIEAGDPGLPGTAGSDGNIYLLNVTTGEFD